MAKKNARSGARKKQTGRAASKKSAAKRPAAPKKSAAKRPAAAKKSARKAAAPRAAAPLAVDPTGSVDPLRATAKAFAARLMR